MTGILSGTCLGDVTLGPYYQHVASHGQIWYMAWSDGACCRRSRCSLRLRLRPGNRRSPAGPPASVPWQHPSGTVTAGPPQQHAAPSPHTAPARSETPQAPPSGCAPSAPSPTPDPLRSGPHAPAGNRCGPPIAVSGRRLPSILRQQLRYPRLNCLLNQSLGPSARQLRQRSLTPAGD